MRQDKTRTRRIIRWVGMGLLFLAVTGFSGSVPDFLVAALASGLIVWGGTRSKLESLEKNVEERLRREVFVEFQHAIIDRLDRIEGKMDTLPCRDGSVCHRGQP